MALSFTCKLIFAALLLSEILEATARTLPDAPMVERHEQWMHEYGRRYKDDGEKARRLKIFKENLDYIESFNSGGSRPYKLGVNKFTDMTNQEFKATRTGYKMESYWNSSNANLSSFRYADVGEDEVPPQVDWREKGAVTDVKNQQQCGCCWAFSAVAAIEGIIQIKTGNLVSLSEQQLVDCDTSNNGGCKGGMMDRAFEFVVGNNGLTTESNYPYQGADGSCNSMTESSAQITGYERVPGNDEAALKAAVANQPISVAIDAIDQFQHYSSGVFTEECGTDMNHAVTLVGYGETGEGMKCWLAKNSWGSSWGEYGYMRILRDVDDPQGLCGLAMYPSYPTAS
ncbi:hypothetical protein ACS0TY_031456 [Phlomoides rotata]